MVPLLNEYNINEDTLNGDIRPFKFCYTPNIKFKKLHRGLEILNCLELRRILQNCPKLRRIAQIRAKGSKLKFYILLIN